MTDQTIRVLLVDDDPLVRTGLKLMLAGADGITVAGEASDGDELDDAVARTDPQVVLLDVRMPRLDGVAALRRLRTTPHGSAIAVIVLTTFRTDAVVLDALRAGAAGFLLKHTPPEQIVDAVRTAAAGQPIVSPSVLTQLIEHARSGGSPAAPDLREAGLSEREEEVALAVADGLSNAEIAEQLYLSLGTVKSHISSALTKLGLENRVQLAIRAHDARPRD
ncbi:response regulator [Cellulomonas xylanilytica]|uniref:DNA-binding response regulator n=1 Tax=Cellulomonas xylanilytica TaxID=233583 RepID=A0A510V4I4_9CELL|nr:response regulator transcription factor [Cellulomonas xylanilytica]GEK21789.1 DNA-binding response regulator [Cellulomonas xylanilytica]